MTEVISRMGSCSNTLRGVFGGGQNDSSRTNQIEYITIVTTGNATDFGDLTTQRNALAACSDNMRGVFGGGYDGSDVNTMDYITIANTGNATDFGDLSDARKWLGSCSGGT